MANTSAQSYSRVSSWSTTVSDIITWVAVVALGIFIIVNAIFLVVHATHVLGYPYPLDYGEGPLLAQVNLLRVGVPIWKLYSDPAAPPYAIVNYPPVYHSLAALLSLIVGNALLAGRLVSLAATIGAVAALWILTNGDTKRSWNDRLAGGLIVLAFLALPIVREWSVFMRVDMLGVCLGLWALVVVQRKDKRAAVMWALPLLLLSLYVKPSLAAAPAAAVLWLAIRDVRRALLFAFLLVISGGLIFALLQIASGGWFSLHVLTANANKWQRSAARTFWRDQMRIHWPLLAAAGLTVLVYITRYLVQAIRAKYLQRKEAASGPHPPPPSRATDSFTHMSSVQALNPPPPFSRTQEKGEKGADASHQLLLPLFYTIFGALTAIGVGKVGAYVNYFLEFYAGLIWLAAMIMTNETTGPHPSPPSPAAAGEGEPGYRTNNLEAFSPQILTRGSQLIAIALVMASLLRYYPTWGQNYVKLAGLIEGKNPARMVFGGYGVWRDLQREHDILTTLARVNGSLVREIDAVSGPIFTDVPGVAAQANRLSRLQAFEHRQLLDVGQWNQRPLLLDMANGRVPLVILDYLGNWLTPEMISLITHRYAQDGSRGTYDLYRPIDPGPLVPARLQFPNGLQLVGYHLGPSPGRPAYHGGEHVVLTLTWQRQEFNERKPYEVVVQLTSNAGQVVLESAQPLLYNVLPPQDWPAGQDVQHMQTFTLPSNLVSQTYRLAITLRIDGHNLVPPRPIGQLMVEEQTGRPIGPQSYYVPAPLLAAWTQAGREATLGDALTPAVPFPGYVEQCFVWGCLQLRGTTVERMPLGELLALGDIKANAAQTPTPLRGPFLDYWHQNGGDATLGPPVTGEISYNDREVQYTRYARLERLSSSGEIQLGKLGEEFLRLPGIAYRWR